MKLFRILLVLCILQLTTGSENHAQQFSGWDTNFTKKSINLDELQAGGPPKDGIPAINHPEFITSQNADSWLEADEPVIAFEHRGTARAYPLQILIWHEIVHDEIDGTPVLVTFCPLCYSAIVFDRRIDREVHEFGVSGFLRHSDMIMFDRKTESFWQQFTGEALVGDYTGEQLNVLPSQIISYEQFKGIYPGGEILSRQTGYDRQYGRNPYSGYDDINNSPMMMNEEVDERLKPMEKVIGVRINDNQKGYPYSITQNKRVINDEFAGTPVVIFHVDGARSALDDSDISKSREDGSTGAYKRTVDDDTLNFEYRSEDIIDTQTESIWDISGKAIAGKLKGKELDPLIFGDYFAFAWLVFWPETKLYTFDSEQK